MLVHPRHQPSPLPYESSNALCSLGIVGSDLFEHGNLVSNQSAIELCIGSSLFVRSQCMAGQDNAIEDGCGCHWLESAGMAGAGQWL